MYKCKHIQEFEDFITEIKRADIKKSNFNIEITKKDDESIPHIEITDGSIDEETFDDLLYTLSDTKKLKKEISGGNNKILDEIKDKDKFEKILNFMEKIGTDERVFPPKSTNYYVDLSKILKKDIEPMFNELFTIAPSMVGKGEVLLTTCYNNVYKSHSVGDCYYTENEDDEKDEKNGHHIEVKTGGSNFFKFTTYLEKDGYVKTLKKLCDDESNKFIKQTDNGGFELIAGEDFNDFVGGISLYCYNRVLKLKKLDLVIFNNDFTGNVAEKTTDGFLYIPIPDKFEDIYNTFKNLIDLSKPGTDKIGGSKSRDFTIGVIKVGKKYKIKIFKK